MKRHAMITDVVAAIQEKPAGSYVIASTNFRNARHMFDDLVGRLDDAGIEWKLIGQFRISVLGSDVLVITGTEPKRTSGFHLKDLFLRIGT